MAFVHLVQGNEGAALARLEELRGLRETQAVLVFIGEVHTARGDYEQAIAHLERAVDIGARVITYWESSEYLAPLHDDPRWVALLDRMRAAQP